MEHNFYLKELVTSKKITQTWVFGSHFLNKLSLTYKGMQPIYLWVMIKFENWHES